MKKIHSLIFLLAITASFEAFALDRPITIIVTGVGSVACPNGHMLTGVIADANSGARDTFHESRAGNFNDATWPPSGNPIICGTIHPASASNCTTLKMNETPTIRAVCVKACG